MLCYYLCIRDTLFLVENFLSPRGTYGEEQCPLSMTFHQNTLKSCNHVLANTGVLAEMVPKADRTNGLWVLWIVFLTEMWNIREGQHFSRHCDMKQSCYQ